MWTDLPTDHILSIDKVKCYCSFQILDRVDSERMGKGRSDSNRDFPL